MFDEINYGSAVGISPLFKSPADVEDLQKDNELDAALNLVAPNESSTTPISARPENEVQQEEVDLLLHNTTDSGTVTEYSMNPADYQLECPIGYGSSAVVHLATYLPSKAQVGIKIIELDRFEKNQIDTLRREIQTMTLCRHPNLLNILASFVSNSQLWIVTPFMAAGSCLDLLRLPENRTGILNEAVIATILWQAIQGLAYLHGQGLIHRDVKAGNLLLDLDGQVQLADFGVSSSLLENHECRGGNNGVGGEANRVRKTFVGTPCWMAPEVMEMTKGYDFKADIWSFGITAYELANGHAPYAKLPAMKVIFVTLSNDPPKLNRHRTKLTFSKAFKDLISQCLQKDPNKRPTAEALLRHPFFKQAKKKDYIATELLANIAPIQNRMTEKRNSVAKPLSSSLRNETILEEDWDFSSSDSSCPDDHTATGEEDDDVADLAKIDRKGRFVVEPASNPSQSPLGLVEDGQGTVQSCEEAIPCAEIRKGRFSVNAAGATPTGGETPAILSPSVETEEEGRKSRFEIVPPQTTINPTSPPANPRSSHSTSFKDASASVEHLCEDTGIETGSNIYRPSPHHAPRTSSFQDPSFASLYSSADIQTSPLMYPHTSSAQIDQLLYLNEMMRIQLLEMRSRCPQYLVSPPSYHQQQRHLRVPAGIPPLSPHYYSVNGLESISPQQQAGIYSPQFSPLSSPTASQGDLPLSDQFRSEQRELERQIQQLKLENDHLKRRAGQ